MEFTKINNSFRNPKNKNIEKKINLNADKSSNENKSKKGNIIIDTVKKPRNILKNKNKDNVKFKVNTDVNNNFEKAENNIDLENNSIYISPEVRKRKIKIPEKNFKNEIIELNLTQINTREKVNKSRHNCSIEEKYPFDYETSRRKRSKNTDNQRYPSSKESEIELEIIKFDIRNYNKDSKEKFINIKNEFKKTNSSKKYNDEENFNLAQTSLTEYDRKNRFVNEIYEDEVCNTNANQIIQKRNFKRQNNIVCMPDMNNNTNDNLILIQDKKETIKSDDDLSINKKIEKSKNILNPENHNIFLDIKTKTFIFNEKNEYQNLSENEFFISKIDKIYELIDISNLDKNPFRYSTLILFFINFINFILFWTMYYITSDYKNNIYCFDRNSGAVGVCNIDDYCSKIKDGPYNMAFISDDNISSEDVLEEIINLNKYFRRVFFMDSLQFSAWNVESSNKTNIDLDYFNNAIVIKKNEEWNLFSYYNLACSKKRILLSMFFVIGLSLIFSTAILSYFADLLGRKPVLIISVLMQIMGLFIFSFFDYYLPYEIDKLQTKYDIVYSHYINIENNNIFDSEGNYNYINISQYIDEYDKQFEDLYRNKTKLSISENDFDNFFNNTYNKSKNEFVKITKNNQFFTIYNITKYNRNEVYIKERFSVEPIYSTNSSFQTNNYQISLNSIFSDDKKKYEFLVGKLDREFQKSFYYFKYQIKKSKMIRDYFLNNIFFPLLGSYLSVGVIPTIYNLSLALILETSLNLSSSIENYKFFNYTYIFSFLIPYFLLNQFNSFKLVFFVLGVLHIIFLILFILLGMESPRILYEISSWDKIKELINNLLKRKYFKRNEIIHFIKNKYDSGLENEFNEENKFSKFKKVIFKRIIISPFSPYTRKFMKFYQKYKAGLIKKIKFEYLIKYPYLNYYLMFKSRNFKDYNLVVLSLVFNLSISLFLLQNKFSSYIIIQRSTLYKDGSIIMSNISFFLLMFFSNVIFSCLDRIWGYHIIMGICYIFIFIFSLILGILNITTELNIDLNKQIYGKIDYTENQHAHNNIILIGVCCFFANGLFYPFFFYLTKFTRTFYRTTLFGFIHMIIFFICMISFPISHFFPNDYLFSCMSSLVGIFISYFVANNQDEILVQDFKRLETEYD